MTSKSRLDKVIIAAEIVRISRAGSDRAFFLAQAFAVSPAADQQIPIFNKRNFAMWRFLEESATFALHISYKIFPKLRSFFKGASASPLRHLLQAGSENSGSVRRFIRGMLPDLDSPTFGRPHRPPRHQLLVQFASNV
ncbi:hypothetical protein Zmor_027485 [Zophobas morio]|uniref:Uncharacterized protein n=1 Tax=Zophobas morio TaxID=2755281 RepID=A0AA38HNB7_9CUCU|nr:hypothetical protein Zmor_027485 [Zophobas morio]